jgi:hypothetical protein
MKANKTVFSVAFKANDSSDFKGYHLSNKKDDSVYVYAREIRLEPFNWEKGWGLRIDVVDKHENNLIIDNTIRISRGERKIWSTNMHYGAHDMGEISFLVMLLLEDVYDRAADLIASRVFAMLLDSGEIDELFEHLPGSYARLFNKTKQVSPEEKSAVAEV